MAASSASSASRSCVRRSSSSSALASSRPAVASPRNDSIKERPDGSATSVPVQPVQFSGEVRLDPGQFSGGLWPGHGDPCGGVPLGRPPGQLAHQGHRPHQVQRRDPQARRGRRPHDAVCMVRQRQRRRGQRLQRRPNGHNQPDGRHQYHGRPDLGAGERAAHQADRPNLQRQGHRCCDRGTCPSYRRRHAELTMATARLPGIYFETVAPPAPALLPRMDIAAFAGFLPSGPIDLPFVVEDSTRFQEIFGTDLTLAWDAQAHQMLLAQTPPSVRTYFRNGGRRCWVLRLANNALPNAWVIPGLLQVDTVNNLSAGWVQARSEGSWSDELTVNATLLESPLPPVGSGPVPLVTGTNPGDTVQLYYPATQTWAYSTFSDPRWFWFQSIQPADLASLAGSPQAEQPESVVLLGPGVNTPLPFQQLSAQGDELFLLVTRDTAMTVQPGSWLEISVGERTLLMQVENIDAAGLVPATAAAELATLTSTLGWW